MLPQVCIPNALDRLVDTPSAENRSKHRKPSTQHVNDSVAPEQILFAIMHICAEICNVQNKSTNCALFWLCTMKPYININTDMYVYVRVCACLSDCVLEDGATVHTRTIEREAHEVESAKGAISAFVAIWI